jgi:hypothetical protein
LIHRGGETMTAIYRLVVRTGPNVGTAYPLEKDELFVGRDLSNDIVINDPEMSRRHSRLYVQGNSYVVEDLGSTNGTSVNGQRLMGPYPLRLGELITFGEHVTMMFDAVQPDSAATVVAQIHQAPPPTARAQPIVPPLSVPQPVYSPPPPPSQPVYAPPPQPAFSGQVPMQPVMEEPEERKRKIPVWLLILIVLLVVVCICGVAVFAIDYFNMWCTLFPFLFGSTCG